MIEAHIAAIDTNPEPRIRSIRGLIVCLNAAVRPGMSEFTDMLEDNEKIDPVAFLTTGVDSLRASGRRDRYTVEDELADLFKDPGFSNTFDCKIAGAKFYGAKPGCDGLTYLGRAIVPSPDVKGALDRRRKKVLEIFGLKEEEMYDPKYYHLHFARTRDPERGPVLHSKIGEIARRDLGLKATIGTGKTL